MGALFLFLRNGKLADVASHPSLLIRHPIDGNLTKKV
jgi:hypothetical protein